MLNKIWEHVQQFFRKVFGWAFSSKIKGAITLVLLFVLLIWGISGFFTTNGNKTTRFRIARDNWWPSSIFSGKERNFEAFSNELFSQISKKEGVTFEFVSSEATTLIPDLNNRVFDGILSVIPPTPSNERFFDFSQPLLLIGPVLIVRSDSDAKSLADLSGRTVGIRAGSSLVFNYLNEMMGDKAPPIYTTFDSMNDAVERLVNNRIDGVIMEAMPAYTVTEGFYKGRLKVATTPLTWEGIRVVGLLSSESGRKMISEINEGLTKLHEDGTYDRLIQKWDLIDPTRLPVVTTPKDK